MTSTARRVNLDLDALDREHVRTLPVKKDPFVVLLGGKEIVFADPVELDASVLLLLFETPLRFFKGTLDSDDYKHMMDMFNTPKKLPGYKMRALMEQYQDYYGLDDAGNVNASRR
jgi:hypothetical protein